MPPGAGPYSGNCEISWENHLEEQIRLLVIAKNRPGGGHLCFLQLQSMDHPGVFKRLPRADGSPKGTAKHLFSYFLDRK